MKYKETKQNTQDQDKNDFIITKYIFSFINTDYYILKFKIFYNCIYKMYE